MKKYFITPAVLAMVLAACGSTGGTESTLAAEVDDTQSTVSDTEAVETTMAVDTTPTSEASMSDGAATTVEDLQQRFAEFASQVESSDAAVEVTAAWNAAQPAMLEAIAAVQTGDVIDSAAVESALNDFEAAVPTTETELMNEWLELRAAVEGAITAAMGS